MSLPTRPLGRTGMAITRVGLGAWQMGGTGWHYSLGSFDEREARAAIERAVDAGVNWVDTAASYGHGRSEELVGATLAGIPEADRPLVFTKGGMVWDDAEPLAAARQVGDPAAIRRGVEASLRRLGVERIDLFQLHWPPLDGTSVERCWQTFVDLREEGKVRAIGVSNFDVAQHETAYGVGRIDASQPRFSAVHRERAADVLPWCAEHDVGVLVYSPLVSGLLSGAYTAERVAALEPGDWRRTSPDFQSPALEANLALADAVADIARRRGTTAAAVGLAWTLAFPGVTGAIAGARRPEQVDGWIDAADLELTEAELDELAAAIERTGAGEGPRRP